MAKATRSKTSKKTPVFKVIPARKARTQFGQLQDLAERGEARFLVQRNGQPSVMILGIDDYLASGLELPEELARLQEDAKKRGIDLMSMDGVDAEIAEVRAKKRA